MGERSATRTGAVMEAVRARLATRAVAPGEKLPSIRSLAATLRVSPSTVVEAYDRLVAEGVVHARHGSGFYVAGRAPLAHAMEADRPGDRALDPFWMSRQSLDASSRTTKPGCGWLPADWMPDMALRRALRALARADGATLVDYGSAHGSPALRRILVRMLAIEGLDVAPDQILLTASGTQATDLVCRLLLRPGDTVLIDDPCYFNFQALLRTHPVKLVGVPYTPTGPDPAIFAETLAAERPRLYITNAALHNPTGATLSAQTAHRLLNAAAAHDVVILEDNIFADLEPEPSPRLAALDGLHHVICIGSFSKTLSASIRCGYVAARHDWIEALTDLQVASNFGGPSPIATDLIGRALTDGSYRKHLDALRRRLARTRREVGDRLAALGIEPWIVPRGGFFLWCRLPEERDSADLARAALRHDMVLAPGNVFSLSQNAAAFMRFNVAQMVDPRITDALGRLLANAGR